MAKQIPLTRGLFAIVDDDDFERLSKFKWQASKGGKGEFYAKRSIGSSQQDRRPQIYMHHEVFGRHVRIDHKNLNALDNRKENLRECTQQQNCCNRSLQKNSHTGLKGVCYIRGRYRSRIYAGKTIKYLGAFDTADEAGHAYDAAAKELHGEFAHLNFPEQAATTVN